MSENKERGRKVVHDTVSCLLSSADEGDTYLEKVCGIRVNSGKSEAAPCVSFLFIF